MSADTLYVPEEHYRIIELVSKGVSCVDDIAERLGKEVSALMRILGELEARGLIRTLREVRKYVELTDEGKTYAEVGLPELKVVTHLQDSIDDRREISVHEYLNLCREVLSERMCNIVLSNLIRMGLIKVESGVVKLLKPIKDIVQEIEQRQQILNLINLKGRVSIDELNRRELVEELHRRKLLRYRERVYLKVELTEHCLKLLTEGKLRPAKLITVLTHDMLRRGTWRNIILKEFDLSIELPEARAAVPHFMREFLKIVREILVELGFEEATGPIVEIEFWNFDALFQAQDHPAREIHDTFFLKDPQRGPEPPREVYEKVARVHEDGWITGSRGWGYKWRLERALRLILRTQTTAVTIRALYQRGEGEYRVFTIGRVFRPETLDPKHSMEFHQADGIVVGRSARFKNLLGLLETFARKLGLEKVMFKPAYFPFTCPSAEGYVWHERLGWVEFVGCGVFRPEVTVPAGVRDCKVLAFGMGLDRLAMTILEIDDIRELYTRDIDRLREHYTKLARKLHVFK